MSLDFTAIDARRSAETAWRAQSVYRETVPVQKVVMSLASAFILTGAIIIVSVFFGGGNEVFLYCNYWNLSD